MDKTPGEYDYSDDSGIFRWEDGDVEKYAESQKKNPSPAKKQRIDGQGKLLRFVLNGDKRLSPPEFTAFSEADKSYIMAAIMKLIWRAEEGFIPFKGFLYQEENYNLFLKAYKN
jgi:hypothetical protein